MTLNTIVTILTLFAASINWQTYTDNVKHFNMKYPDKWTKQNSANTIIFLSPRESDKDLFQENVNLMLQDLSKQPMNLSQYTELAKKQIIDNLGASAIVSIKKIILAGQQGREIVYYMKYQSKSLKLKQYWFIKESTAYLFTYTAEPSDYDKYESVATTIINSFRFFK